jgi:aryl-alcohol dehydrogenase-like predicted oxidoreductase
MKVGSMTRRCLDDGSFDDKVVLTKSHNREMKPPQAPPATIPEVVLGATRLRVSAVGLGCSRLGSLFTGITNEAAVRLVQHALRRGITLFDTADIYGQGESERIVGRALGKDRLSVTLVTKGGQRFAAEQRIASLARRPISFLAKRAPAFRELIAAKRARPLPRNYTAAYLQRALEESLRRLRTDYIDVYLLHSPSGTEIQKSDSFAMLERVKDKGLIRHWGISCDDLSGVDSALRTEGIGVLEVPLAVLYPGPGPEPAALADFSACKAGLIVGQILTSRDAVMPMVTTPKQRIELVLRHPNAAAIVGTTSMQHLNEAVAG